MDQTPTQLFESYEADFQLLLSSIKDKLEGSGKGLQGESRKASLRKVEIELDEADDIVSQLEIEIQGIPTSIRGQYTNRLKQTKAELSKYRKISKDSHTQAARTDLLGANRSRSSAGASDDPYGERNDRTRLLAGTETLEDGTRRLNDSTRIALETETYGADILRGLRGQREQIENARDTLRSADANIDRSHGKIQTMMRQMYKQRVILILIGVLFAQRVIVVSFPFPLNWSGNRPYCSIPRWSIGLYSLLMLTSLGVLDPFDRPHRFIYSVIYTPRQLAIQRLLLAVYGGATLITSIVYESVVLRQGNIWFSYFTHLTYIGLTSYFLLSAYHGLGYKPTSTPADAYPLQRWKKILQALHILLLSTVTTFPLLVTICYWALIASPATFANTYESWTAVSLHILNTVFTLLEISTSRIPPLPWTTLPVCLLLLLAYLGVAYITHFNTGVYTYEFLDPQTQHTKLAAYIVGIAVAEIILFVIVRYAIVLRDRMFRFAPERDDDSEPQKPKEALDEWEQVNWDDAERHGGRGSTRSSVVQSVAEAK
ncbi:hypothetical protein NP233_g7108 [Leucocoprinus birnbaumii]|uniref:t-SNARE coiled-coil homology domain-containing protein n=1 Tax=Leucocoprinus birnbaumii TaxID=56174 RepID=A0AAD5VVB8_9AGAR|nr:hypothetical protein NP233_g7108 [Leucocoprinus birnbaumii]